jgi:hypothetical protein
MAPTLSLAAASRLSGVSQPTLRKHVVAGHLEAVKGVGKYGDTWRIAPAALAAWVAARYGRVIDVADLDPEPAQPQTPADVAGYETAVELRQRLDETLVELGKYKALTAAADDADTRVEDILRARIAELTIERDAALKRRWWRRK